VSQRTKNILLYILLIGIALWSFDFEIRGGREFFSNAIQIDAFHMLGEVGMYAAGIAGILAGHHHGARSRTEKIILYINAIALGGSTVYFAFQAVCSLWYPLPLGAEGGLIYGIASLGSNLLQYLLMTQVKEAHSDHVHESNLEHLLGDCLSSLAILIGLGLAWLTGRVGFDSIAALAASWVTFNFAIKNVRRAMGHHVH